METSDLLQLYQLQSSCRLGSKQNQEERNLRQMDSNTKQIWVNNVLLTCMLHVHSVVQVEMVHSPSLL
jgi:hypothetical protein